jgi:hypothetical protein
LTVGWTLAAIALGIVGTKYYTSRTGRMQAFNHAGNVFAAAIAGLACYLIALPLRGVLFSAVQQRGVLDLGADSRRCRRRDLRRSVPTVIADLTRGTGRYNVTVGAASTVQGIGASFSTTVAGVIIVTGRYDLAFPRPAGMACLALLIFYFAPVWPRASATAADGSGLPEPAGS